MHKTCVWILKRGKNFLLCAWLAKPPGRLEETQKKQLLDCTSRRTPTVYWTASYSPYSERMPVNSPPPSLQSAKCKMYTFWQVMDVEVLINKKFNFLAAASRSRSRGRGRDTAFQLERLSAIDCRGLPRPVGSDSDRIKRVKTFDRTCTWVSFF